MNSHTKCGRLNGNGIIKPCDLCGNPNGICEYDAQAVGTAWNRPTIQIVRHECPACYSKTLAAWPFKQEQRK